MAKERRKNISSEIWFQKYRILDQLGEGGTGSVFLAEHIHLGYLRAIKRIRKDHPSYRQLRQEADILKSLKHPCIPRIYDVEEDAAYSYMIMEYMEGLSLKALCLEQGHIKEKEIVLICSQICEVFQLLHSAEYPILYLDLKPSNIIVKESKIKLIDFGAAKRVDGRKEILSMGTRGFAAPEQYELNGADRQSDIYGLGNLMLFMATGRCGSEGLKLLEEASGYTEALKKTIFQCLKYNKAERFETIDQVKESLTAPKPEERAALSDASVLLAFAGVQPRCGVTHICLLLAEYLCLHGQRAVYVEAGSKRDVQLLCQTEGKPTCPVLCGNPLQLREKYREYAIFICDYGSCQAAPEELWRADTICLVTGARAWERPFWEEAEHRLAKEKEKEGEKRQYYFLINLINAREFFYLAKKSRISCLRMPYRDSVLREDKELSLLLGRLLKRSVYERDICCGKGKAKKDKKNSENRLSGWSWTGSRGDAYRNPAGRIFRRKERGKDSVSGNK